MGRKSLGLNREEMKAHRAKLERERRHKRIEEEKRLVKTVISRTIIEACDEVISDVYSSEEADVLSKALYDAILKEMVSHTEWKMKIEPTDD